jgi:Holliday junction resolvase RusA-like endonuclease
MTTIKISLPIIPKAQARARSTFRTKTGKIGVYKDKKQDQAEQNLCALLLPYQPERPLEGPLVLRVTVGLPIPASWPKKRQAAAQEGHEQPTGKPDLDNLVKHLKDCLTAVGFWRDDKQVVELYAEKTYSLNPGWIVELWYSDLGKFGNSTR